MKKGISDEEIIMHLHRKKESLLAALKKVNAALFLYKNTYPLEATWKDKIFFILEKNNKSLSSAQIIKQIKDAGEPSPLEHIKSMVPQYLSSLGLKGEIRRVKENKKFRYFIQNMREISIQQPR